MAGFQEIYEERHEPGPDGKLVKKVYTVRRELTDQQAEELFKEKIQKIEPVFSELFPWLKPSKPEEKREPIPFSEVFKNLDRFFGK